MNKNSYKQLNLLSYNRIKTLKFADWLIRQHIKFELDTTGAGNVFTIFIKRDFVDAATESGFVENWIINAYTDIMDSPSVPQKINGRQVKEVILDEWYVLPETDRVNILSEEKRKIKEEMRRNNELSALEDRIKGLENEIKNHNKRLYYRAEWDDTHNEQIVKLNHRMDGLLELLKGRASRSAVEAMDKNFKRRHDNARDTIKDIENRLEVLEDLERARIIEEGGWDD
jgi:hypothetical protein